MRESGYYPPGTEFDRNAPWNETDAPDAAEVIDDLDGKDFFESSAWDVDASLGCFDGRVRFEVPNLYRKRWVDLTEAEQAAFEAYAVAVRAFASLYEKGLDEDQ